VVSEVPASLVNLRDVASAHPALAAGVLLRSDAPAAADDHTSYTVAWPPATVLDLRVPTELVGAHPFSESAVVVSLPISGRSAFDGVAAEKAVDSLEEMYARMLEQPRAATLVQALEVIATGETPVLVHCTAGKDRTGVTVALALLLVGVDRASVVADYHLTHGVMPRVFARMPATVAGVAQRLAEQGGEPGGDLPAWLGTAPAEAMHAFIDALDARGGALSWYLAAGGSEDVVEQLRSRLLVP